jgi:hypothetical protein
MTSNISSDLLPKVGRTEVLRQDLNEVCLKLHKKQPRVVTGIRNKNLLFPELKDSC